MKVMEFHNVEIPLIVPRFKKICADNVINVEERI